MEQLRKDMAQENALTRERDETFEKEAYPHLLPHKAPPIMKPIPLKQPGLWAEVQTKIEGPKERLRPRCCVMGCDAPEEDLVACCGHAHNGRMIVPCGHYVGVDHFGHATWDREQGAWRCPCDHEDDPEPLPLENYGTVTPGHDNIARSEETEICMEDPREPTALTDRCSYEAASTKALQDECRRREASHLRVRS